MTWPASAKCTVSGNLTLLLTNFILINRLRSCVMIVFSDLNLCSLKYGQGSPITDGLLVYIKVYTHVY